MNAFGKLLRNFRNKCADPYHPYRRLSQERLGELLGEELGDLGFSGAAVSDWERGKSQIYKNNRLVLIAILKILYKNGGLGTLSEAESLLEAGNYRALDENEKQQIFPKELLEIPMQPIISNMQEDPPPAELSSGDVFSIFGIQRLVNEVRDGPLPVWPRVTTAIMRKIGDWVGGLDLIHAFIWLAIWILSYILIIPALRWPFPNRQIAKDLVTIYIGASFILPLLIGLLTITDKNPVWKDRQGASHVIIRLYTHQGAFIGFHVGYFAVFAIHLIAFYLQFGLAVWFQFMLAGFPLFMGAVAAHVVPDNLWRAYKRLWLSDGWIFFVFIPLGPVWGWFFLEYYLWLIYPVLGSIIIVAALILTTRLTKRKQPISSTHH